MEEKELEARAFIYSKCGNATLNINKLLIRNLGLPAAALLECLVSKERYFSERNMLDSEGYFWNTEEDRQDDCGLTPYQQSQAIDLLTKLDIISVKRKGLPARQFFRASYQNFKNLFLKFQELDVKNLRTIYINNNKLNKNNKKEISKDILEDACGIQPIIIERKSRRTAPRLISSNQTLSVQKVDSPKAKEWILPKGWKMSMVNAWNLLWDILPKDNKISRHTDMTTKTACRVAKWLEYLSKGVFFDYVKVNSDFILRNSIPQRWIDERKKFSQREIFYAIQRYALYFRHGYWPPDKKTLPKRFDTFIFNEETGRSFLLRLIANPNVKPIAEERKQRDRNPQYTEHFESRGLLKHFSNGRMPEVYQGISSIENYVVNKQIFNFENGSIKLNEVVGQGKGKLEPMFESYAKYLNQQNRLDWDKIFMPYGHFQDFLQELKNYYSSFEVKI